MALQVFNQRYIDNIDSNNVPEEFINYFDGIELDAQKRIIESRPDLADVLSFNSAVKSTITNDTTDTQEQPEISEDTEDEDNSINYIEDDFDLEDNTELEPSEDKIENIYENIDFSKINNTSLLPIHLLTITDGEESCVAHRLRFEKIRLSYKVKGSRGDATFGYSPLCCPKCKRLFIYESEVNGWSSRFEEYKLEYKIYNKEEANKIILDEIEDIIVGKDSTLYVPDVWIQDNPKCPIHDIKIKAYPHVIGEGSNKISFKGYICDKCNKTLIRRSVAMDIIDTCDSQGIITPRIEPIRKEIKTTKAKAKKIIPQFMIDNGKRSAFPYKEANKGTYFLAESDTVVVSDSAYCSLEGHDTEEIEAAYVVNEKRNHRQNYLSLVGYCHQCQKFYMDEADYKVIYSYGRPEFTVIRDLIDDEYLVTSGEVYNIEKEHLDTLEGDIRKDIKEIESNEDYHNPFETEKGGDYDAISRLYVQKAWSKEKYEGDLDELYSYISTPYRYRVDIISGKKTEVYYIGAKDITLDGDKKVISMASDMGRTLVNTRTTKYSKDGKEYDVKLSREFEIKEAYLYGYKNIKTDEDAIFRAGITDPFLVKVLNQRRRQHELVDIFVTIQENQNSIVDEELTNNIIVQGCAGSGKTMVMLHRLYTLKYNHPEFNFDSALILTPNERFSLHIKGLADSLQIGGIDRVSVEQYYLLLCNRYGLNFPNSKKVTSEKGVKKEFVDYIYSDGFIDKFNEYYEIVIADKKNMVSVIENLSLGMQEDFEPLAIMNDSDFIPEIKNRLTHLKAVVQRKEKKIEDAHKAVENATEEKQRITTRLPEVETRHSGILDEVLTNVKSKLALNRSNVTYNIAHYEEEINNLLKEKENVQSQFMIFGKRSKVEDIDKQINLLNGRKKKEEEQLFYIEETLKYDRSDKTEEEIVNWVKSLVLIEKSIQDEIALYERVNREYESLVSNALLVEDKIKEATAEYEQISKEKYPSDVYKALKYLESQIDENDDYHIFKEIFTAATKEYKEEHKIRLYGGLHRYDLYAALWFCIKYYGKKLGDSKLICFDEGQDVAYNEYRLIYELNNSKPIYNIYGDTKQLLKQGRGISSWDRLAGSYSMKMFYLNENYRNTNQITQYCNDNFDMSVKKTGVDGIAVREIPRRELKKELSQLSVNNDKIAVLLPNQVKKKMDYIVRNVLPDEIKNALGETIENGRIAVMYVDEVKGIEFDKVFVVSHHMSINEKYIAYTRALSELTIVVDESIPDVADNGSGRTEIGELVDFLRRNNLSDAKLLYDDISFGWERKNCVGLFRHLFLRVNQYECIFKLMVLSLSDVEIKRVFSSLDDEIKLAVNDRIVEERIKEIIEYAKESNKDDYIPVIFDIFNAWEENLDIPDSEIKDLYLKSSSKKAGEAWLKSLSYEEKDSFYELMKSYLNDLSPNNAFNICILAWQDNGVSKNQIADVIELYSRKNAKGDMAYSCPRDILLNLAVSSTEETWTIVEKIVNKCSARAFSDARIKRYPQAELPPKTISSLELLVNSKLTLEQKVFMYMNTSLREDSQIERFLVGLGKKEGVSIEEILSKLRNYWIVGTIKYVTEDGFVRVAPQNIASSRLICFWSSNIHITGDDGVWVEPKEGDKIYFLLRRYDEEKNFLTLHYPCVKPIEVKE